jgi:hypothetical protein
MGGWKSGSVRRSGRLLDGELHKLKVSQIVAQLHVRAHDFGAIPAIFTLRYSEEKGHRVGFDPHVELPYGLAGEPAIRIGVTTTRPQYGGVRYWFVCPSSICRRRCSVLYGEQHTNVRALRCRHCLRVRYETQVLGKSLKLAARLARPLSRVLLRDWSVGRPLHASQDV